ncbi:MAG: delta-lactam-biosynthetic de-N-acetylase [Clostridiaceae bacterium]
MKNLIFVLLIPIILVSCSSNNSYKKISPTNTSTSIIQDNTINKDNLSTKELNWFYEIKKDETPSSEPTEILDLINKYSAYYLGDTSKKIIYLTFDEGYENGLSENILDILKGKDVKAAFFVTTTYIKANPELIKRMVNEGHLVCNHSTHHPSMASILDINKFKEEFDGCDKAYKDLIGDDIPKYFRPPMGKYSEYSLYQTDKLGYKTIFWSFAYADWDNTKQPSKEYAMKTIMDRTHPGAIFLLHAVSKTNNEILGSVIDNLKSRGYSFDSLDNLPER